MLLDALPLLGRELWLRLLLATLELLLSAVPERLLSHARCTAYGALLLLLPDPGCGWKRPFWLAAFRFLSAGGNGSCEYR